MKKALCLLVSLLLIVSLVAPMAFAEAPEQVFTFAILDDPDSFDPGYTLNSFAGTMFYSCYVGLVKYDVNSELVPGAAESWDVTDDGLEWTFHLVDGMKWSDGSPLTAEDFAFAWQRVLTPEFGASGAYMLYNYIQNAQAYYNGECEWEDVGIKAVDDTTLVVTLAAPCSYFTALLATWTYMPVCKAVVEANPDWATDYKNYVSNGPFKLVDYTMTEGIYLEKNDQYWLADDVHLDKMNLKIFQDLDTAFNAYEAGELDGMTRVPSASIPTLKGRDDFYSITQFSHTYWMFNTTSEFLKDPLVRKALAISIDRVSLIEDVLQASYTPASGHVPFGYIQSDGQDFREAGGYYGITEDAQIDEALALLAEAGYEDPSQITIRVCYYTSDTVKKVAEALARMWEKNLGIKCVIESAEWTVFYDQILGLDYDVAAMGDAATYLHPMAFLQTYQGANPPLETGWRSAEYDELLAKALQTTDEAEADQCLHAAEDLFMNDYVLLPLYYGSTAMVMKDYVSNWALTGCAVDVFENIEILPH